MLVGDVVTRVRRQLVEATGSYWSDTELIDLINDAERDFVNKTRPLFGQAYLDTVIGKQVYPLPATFLSSGPVFYNDLQGTTNQWYRLIPTTIEKIAQTDPDFIDTTVGNQDKPREYMIWNKSMYLIPTPNVAGSSNITCFFRARPSPFDSSSPVTAEEQDLNIDDSFVDAIVSFVLWKSWAKDQEPKLSMEHKAYYEEGVKEARRWLKKVSLDMRNKLDIDSPLRFTLGDNFTKGFYPF